MSLEQVTPEPPPDPLALKIAILRELAKERAKLHRRKRSLIDRYARTMKEIDDRLDAIDHATN